MDKTLILRIPPPPDRSIEQIRNHYLVEKAIADRLRSSDREERKNIYLSMYDELFAKVPDHPRLIRRSSKILTQQANKSKLKLIWEYLEPTTVFAEFAPGDCRFAIEVAKQTQKVYGIDISDQSGLKVFPKNFELIIYDGYNLDLPNGSVDLIFSDQLIEHLHPEDTELHFHLVNRILRKGGRYVFRTPHAFTGPHDISKYFSDEPEGFHLKEWTYLELWMLLKRTGFAHILGLWKLRGTPFNTPIIIFALIELLIKPFSHKVRKRIAKSRKLSFLRDGIYIKAVKATECQPIR